MGTRTAVLLVSCPDRPGIVAAVTTFVAARGGNVVDLQQHTDHSDGVFFQRVQFELGPAIDHGELARSFASVADEYGMDWSLHLLDTPPRLAVLASKEPHCLQDLLTRWRTGELAADVAVVVSNHPDHSELAAWFGVPYVCVPVVDGDRARQEAEVERVLEQERVSVLVLARYMQILSADLCARWRGRIINIHHSFLPAFQGARPYQQAHDRGVKLIGVTAHYVTADLDGGPIIDQDVLRVSHRDDVADLRRKGRDLEVAVLARAVRAHVSHRVLVYGNKTVVFDD
jgi:formyltetrahydrofolate deformylase